MVKNISLEKFFLLLVCFACTVKSFSQQGWWTWMKGPKLTDQSAVWGTQGTPAAANNPAANYGPSYWTDSKGHFWIFAGSDRVIKGQDDMWMFDPVTNMWTWKHGVKGLNSFANYGTIGVSAPTNIPAARQFGSASWTDAQDNLWMFGGDGWAPPNQNGSFADMWKYNTTTNEWTWINGPQGVNQPGSYGTKGVPSPTNYPPSRMEVSASWVDQNGKFWMFGGQRTGLSGYDYLNDMWKYDPVTNEWTWMAGPNTPNSAGSYGTKGVPSATNLPPARTVYAHWVDINGNLWFFGGGKDVFAVYNDLWKYNVSTNQWTWVRGSNSVNPPPQAPPTKCSPTSTIDPAARLENRSCWVDSCYNFWMFGGVDYTATPYTYFNDLWMYNVKNDTWTLAAGNANASFGTIGTPAASNTPTHRSGSVPFTDATGNMWIFGGVDSLYDMGPTNYSRRSDLWKFLKDSTCTPSSCSIIHAGFYGTNLSGCVALTVIFTNTSINTTSWDWNFGDGNTSIVKNPVHTYTAAGTYSVSLIAHNSTTSDTSIQINYVNVYPNAVAAFAPSADTVCIGQNITFTNGSTNASSYTWNFGDGTSTSSATNPSHSYTASGTYTINLIAVNSNGCNDTIAMPITVLTLQTISSFTANPTGCLPLTVNFTNTSTGATNYSWNFGNGQTSTAANPSTTYTATGTYTVTLISSTSNSFCSSSDTTSFVITVGSGPTVATISTQTSCTLNTGTATANPSGGNSPYTFIWNNGQTSQTATGLSAGNYSVVVTDAGGCSATQTVSVTQLNGITATTSSTPNLCGNNTGTAAAAVIGGNSPYSYIWNNGQTTASLSNLSSGNYSVTITDANGCTTIQTVSISAVNASQVSAGSDITIVLGNNTQLNASGGNTYSWSPSTGLSCTNCQSPVASPNSTTTYTVISTDANGCTDVATVTVYVEIPCNMNLLNAVLPTAFSPNDDGENDQLCAQNNTCIESFTIQIYSRWGEKVFESVSLSECWDGNFRGEKMNTAVFAYIFDARLSNGDTFRKKGNITLIR